jgi:hypothetical protein
MFVECIPKKTCFALIVDACHSAGMIEGAKEKVGRSEVKIKRFQVFFRFGCRMGGFPF